MIESVHLAGDQPGDGLREGLGSLFSGYGGLDLAVEQVFNAETVWFSEINEPIARVFAHHWPDAPNLGDITTIDWNTVPPVDVLCGEFPCQDVSTVGKQADLAPGTHSRLWSQMAAAIDALQPEFVVIENVRGLLSAPAVRNLPEGANDDDTTPMPQSPATMQPQPFARWNPTRGVWETSQPDLFARLAPWRETWPICGEMRDGSAYRLQPLALPTSDSASSSSPTALFRIPLASDSSRGGETLEQVRARRGTIALSHQIIDIALHGPDGSPKQSDGSETLCP